MEGTFFFSFIFVGVRNGRKVVGANRCRRLTGRQKVISQLVTGREQSGFAAVIRT